LVTWVAPGSNQSGPRMVRDTGVSVAAQMGPIDRRPESQKRWTTTFSQKHPPCKFLDCFKAAAGVANLFGWWCPILDTTAQSGNGHYGLAPMATANSPRSGKGSFLSAPSN
jgi:hypothetical protein